MRYAVNTSLLAVQTKKRKIWYALDVKHSNLDRKMNGAYPDYIYIDSLHTETAFKNLSKFHNIWKTVILSFVRHSCVYCNTPMT